MRRSVVRQSTVFALTAALVFSFSAPAWSEEEQPDRIMLRLGGYHARNANSIVRLDANNAPVGTYLDFNKTLGGDTQTTVTRLDGLYRFNDRHGLGLSWYALRFNGSKVLEKDIEWNGQTYPFNTLVDSEIRFDVYKLNYDYSLFHTEEAELGASAGFHVMRTGVSIAAQGINRSGSESVTAPLPVWGLFANYHFTPRFTAYYNYQFFFINYQNKIKGGLQDFLFGLEYRVFRNIALGAAYNRFALYLDARGDASTIYLDTNWNGGLLYGAMYF